MELCTYSYNCQAKKESSHLNPNPRTNKQTWFLGKNRSNFVSLPWKLDNPYCNTFGQLFSEQLFQFSNFKIDDEKVVNNVAYGKKNKSNDHLFRSIIFRKALWLTILAKHLTIVEFQFESFVKNGKQKTNFRNWWNHVVNDCTNPESFSELVKPCCEQLTNSKFQIGISKIEKKNALVNCCDHIFCNMTKILFS